MVSWVGEFEYGRLALPVPDRQILLDVSVDLAAERARRRAGEEPDRARDAYERIWDAASYAALANALGRLPVHWRQKMHSRVNFMLREHEADGVEQGV